MTVRPTASVVVCAYTEERWSDLCDALASVRAQEPAPDEVILVVDHNEALLRRATRELAGVTVTPNRHGQGLSGARNTGVEHASSDVVAFLDDDATARPGWLAALVAPFADDAVTAAGGAVVPAWAGEAPAWLPPAFWWVVGCSYDGLPTTEAPIRNPIGASMAFRRDRLNAVGGFREGLGRVGRNTLGCEETEVCIRASQRWPECRHVYVPASVADHRVPARRCTWSYFTSRCYSEGLSKAAVASLVGSGAGLSAERTHALQVLPRAVATAGRRAVSARRVAPLAAAAAVGVGAAAVVAGMGVGSLRRRRASRPEERRAHIPSCVLDYQTGRPFPSVPALDPDGRPYRRAVVLVRSGTRPVGMVSVDLGDGDDPETLERRVLAEAGDAMARVARGGRPDLAAR